MYQFGNLTPSDGTMVQDARFGLRWHTTMKIGTEEGTLIFLQPEEERLPIIEQEHAKLYYLVGKFLTELKSRHKIYVVRSNAELSIELLRSMLNRLRAIGDATLLVVKQSSEHNSARTGRL
jgi:beta-phosphoglucomutase-like phosphatase (HAD superfamily)